jgi:hypothetical protein
MTIRRGPLRLPRMLSALSAVACAAVVLSGCGSQPAGPRPGAIRTSTARPASTIRPVSPRQRAAADAARIMASFPRPPEAVRTGLIASLTHPGTWPATPDLASVTRWWRVPGRPRAVLAWIRGHLPSGFTPDATGTGPGSWTDVFALPAVPGVLTQRQLVVLATAYRGQTAIRVDAQVTWLPARPAAERVPPDATVITVTPVFGLNPNPRARRLDHAFTVTDPAKVARIVAVVNGLTRFPDGAYSCPADFGGLMRLTFSARRNGPVLARLTAEYGGCGSVSVRIGGRDMPALSEYPPSGPLLQQQVLAIAGVSWPVQPGTPA